MWCKCGGMFGNQPLKITKWGHFKDSKWSRHKIETFWGAQDFFGPIKWHELSGTLLVNLCSLSFDCPFTRLERQWKLENVLLHCCNYSAFLDTTVKTSVVSQIAKHFPSCVTVRKTCKISHNKYKSPPTKCIGNVMVWLWKFSKISKSFNY